jgi:divalent metal cation (Fe/Co/Zn/Cd) transporter
MKRLFPVLQDTRFKTGINLIDWTFPLWGSLISFILGFVIATYSINYIIYSNSILIIALGLLIGLISSIISIISLCYAIWYWGGLVIIYSIGLSKIFILKFIIPERFK